MVADRRARRLMAALSACLVVQACASHHAPPNDGIVGLALVGADVVDVETGVLRRDQTLLVQGDRIIALGDARTTPPPSGFRRIEARGKTVIPGLWDMHTHVSSANDCVLPIMVTYGITGIRDMGASGGVEEVRSWRSAIQQGRLTGPDMRIATAAFESLKWLQWVEQLEGRPWREGVGERIPLGSVTDAVEAVRAAQASGADLIKVRNIDPTEGDILRALLAEAERLDIRVAGHAPRGAVMNADVLNPETRDRLGAGGRGFASLEHFDALYLGNLDDAARRTVFEHMRDNGVMVTATTLAIRSRTANRETLSQLANDDGAIQPDVSPRLRGKWRESLARPVQDFDWTAILARADADVRIAHAVGVDILVGSDLGVPGLIPGQVIHDELAIMVDDFGMSPVEALRTATINPPKFWGQEDELGSIAPGRRADFILLDADPLTDIRATRRIAGVMLRGDYYDADGLARLRDETRRMMQSGGQCAAA